MLCFAPSTKNGKNAASTSPMPCHITRQSSAHSRDSISDKYCSRGACSVRLQSAPLGTRCKAIALPGGKAWLKSPLPYDTESTACETNPHSVSAWERTPRLSVRKPPPHLLSLITRYVTIIPRESPAGMGKVIRLLSFISTCVLRTNLTLDGTLTHFKAVISAPYSNIRNVLLFANLNDFGAFSSVHAVT